MISRLPFDPEFSFSDFRRALPALAFFGGFIWDAMTLGRSVGTFDLLTLAAYLSGAAALLWYLGRDRWLSLPSVPHPVGIAPSPPPPSTPKPWWREAGLYMLLQFFFGGLFSALFIFYFKSSSHLLAYFWALALGILLVANEFLEDGYRHFTLTWALFGLCAMLLLNFALPHLVGSISAFWFYLSTLAGAGLAHWLHHKTPGQPGRIKPVWAIAAGLVLAHALDIIPPVPLVKKDIAVGHALSRDQNHFLLRQEKTPWWMFWRDSAKYLRLAPGERIHCVSAVFAPRGLSTRLYHHWQRHDEKQGWVTYSRIGFSLSGGRQAGYRGYTWKQNISPGEWRVAVETEDGRTVAVHEFEIADTPLPRDIEWEDRRI